MSLRSSLTMQFGTPRLFRVLRHPVRVPTVARDQSIPRLHRHVELGVVSAQDKEPTPEVTQARRHLLGFIVSVAVNPAAKVLVDLNGREDKIRVLLGTHCLHLLPEPIQGHGAALLVTLDPRHIEAGQSTRARGVRVLEATRPQRTPGGPKDK